MRKKIKPIKHKCMFSLLIYKLKNLPTMKKMYMRILCTLFSHVPLLASISSLCSQTVILRQPQALRLASGFASMGKKAQLARALPHL